MIGLENSIERERLIVMNKIGGINGLLLVFSVSDGNGHDYRFIIVPPSYLHVAFRHDP